MTLQERRLVVLLRWWVGLFSGAAIIFAVFPDQLIYWLNSGGRQIFGWPFQTLPYPTERFWQVLAVSLLVVLIFAAVEALQDIRQNLAFVKLIIVSKLATTVGFLLAAVLHGPFFAYIAGMVIDLIILLLTWFCYRRTVVSRGL